MTCREIEKKTIFLRVLLCRCVTYMAKHSAIFLLGLFVALLPWLGFPHSWDVWLLVGSGSALVVLGLLVRRDSPQRENGDPETRPFVDLTRQEVVPEEAVEESLVASDAGDVENPAFATADISPPE